MGRGQWVALVVVVSACSDGGGGADASMARSRIFVDDWQYSASVNAWFYDRDWPDRGPLEEGTCEIMPRPSACAACDFGEACDDGTCVEARVLVGVGSLTLEGT